MSLTAFIVPSRYPVVVTILSCLFIAIKIKLLHVAEPASLVGLKLLPMGIIYTLADKLGSIASNPLSKRYAGCIQVGLALSALGDLCLELESHLESDRAKLCFLGGLGSFLLAHLAYVYALFTNADSISWSAIFLSYSYAGCFVFFLWDGISATFMKGAVAFYATALASMLCAAICRGGTSQATRASVVNGVIGALLFTVSDSVLGFDRFKVSGDRVKLVEITIMSTYYAAQYFLALSINGTNAMSQTQQDTRNSPREKPAVQKCKVK